VGQVGGCLVFDGSAQDQAEDPFQLLPAGTSRVILARLKPTSPDKQVPARLQ